MEENLENKTNEGQLNTETEQQENQQNGRFYSDEEIRMIEQVAGDRRISQYQKKAEAKIREAEKLAKMNEEQKREYEFSKREQEITERENALALLENKSACMKILADKHIPLDFVDFVVTSEDADVMNRNIQIIDKAFKRAVKEEVERRLASNSPKKAIDTNGITREDARKMSLSERQKLADSDPDLYKALWN